MDGWANLPQELLLQILAEHLGWERCACSTMRATCVAWRCATDSAVPSLQVKSWPSSTRGFPSITSLEVASCGELTDMGLRHALGSGHLAKVQKLSLGRCCKLTDGGMRSLRSLPALSHLHLELCGDSVSSDSVQATAALTALRSLRLSDAVIDCRTVYTALAEATTITSLHIQDCCDHSDECNCESEEVDVAYALSKLSLESLTLTDETLTVLWKLASVKLTTLTTLKISADDADEEEHAALLHLLLTNKSLVTLDLDGYGALTDEHVDSLRGLTCLQCLRLTGCDEDMMLGDELSQVFRATPALSELSLTECGVIYPSCFEVLGTRTALTSLKLSGCGFYYEEPEEEELVAKMRTLTCLDLHGCGLQPPALVAAIGQLSGLRTLKLSGKGKDLDVHEYSARTYAYSGEIGDVLGGAISKLTALTRIDLDAVELSHRTAASLGRMTSLQSLTLHCCSFDKAGDSGFLTQSLGNLTALRHLSLNRTRSLGLARAGAWARSLSSLTTLNLFGTNKASNGHLHTLRSLRALRTLHLDWTCKPEPEKRQVLAGPWKSRLRSLVTLIPELSSLFDAEDGTHTAVDLMTLPDATLIKVKAFAENVLSTATEELERRNDPVAEGTNQRPFQSIMQSIKTMNAISFQQLRGEIYSSAAAVSPAPAPAAVPAAAVLSLRMLWLFLIRALLAIPRALHGGLLRRAPGGFPQLHRPGLSPAQSSDCSAQAKEESANLFLPPSLLGGSIQSTSAMAEHRSSSLGGAMGDADRKARKEKEKRRLLEELQRMRELREKADRKQEKLAEEAGSSVYSLAALVGSLPSLSALHLHLFAAEDRDVSALSDPRLASLVRVRLQLNPQLTDRGLLPLCALPSLSEVLLVTGNAAVAITAAGEKALRDARRHRPPFHLTVTRGTAQSLGFSRLL